MSLDVIGYECRFAIHIPGKHNETPDIHLIKEQVHYSDGTVKPNLRFIKNFKRKFWITKPSYRNHKDKKEWEDEDKLLCRETTQTQLRNDIAKALDKSWSNESLKDLSSSPYLYGSDITSTALIKKSYMDKYPDLVTAYTVAVFDTETDVVNGTEEVIMASLVFKDKAFISVCKDFVKGISSLETLFQQKAKKYIGEYLDKHNMTIELHVAEDTIDCIQTVFNKAHEWKPDFLAIWNMDFDISRILQMCDKYKYNPADILCDPAVPQHLRICKYRQGNKKKTTASGKIIPINPAMQWHTLISTSSFYVIDAMCAYKHIRITKQEEPSYSLDSILNKELGIRKLKFEEADAYTGLKWHQVMQTMYKLEYMVYNVFDSLSIIELDNHTKDLAYTLPAFSAASDFSNFKSQPKRIIDALYFLCLEKGKVLGTVGKAKEIVKSTSDNIIDENDDGIIEEPTEDEQLEEEEATTLSLRGWVVTLPAHLSVHGMHCIEEDETMYSNLRAYVYDSDAVSAYPTCTSIANVSKETTKRELISIEGIPEDIFRAQNLNLVLGRVNSIEYCTTMFNMPKPEELLKLL
jgi:hypothetical protein